MNKRRGNEPTKRKRMKGGKEKRNEPTKRKREADKRRNQQIEAIKQ
jgi:hypothetical protein